MAKISGVDKFAVRRYLAEGTELSSGGSVTLYLDPNGVPHYRSLKTGRFIAERIYLGLATRASRL